MTNTNEEDDAVDYDLDLAADYIIENISEELNEKLSHKDIVTLLELEGDYIEKREKENLTKKPFISFDLVIIEQEDINYYVWTNAIKRDIILSEEEIEEIMCAEIDYMEEIGMTGEETMMEN